MRPSSRERHHSCGYAVTFDLKTTFGHCALRRHRAAAKPKTRRKRAHLQRPISLPEIRSREHQAKSSGEDSVHEEFSSSRGPGGASFEPHSATARVVMGQVDAVKEVLEGTVSSGGRTTVNGHRKARETHLNHSQTKVRSLAKETRKQHNHDRNANGMLQKRTVSGLAPSTSLRSQSQSSFQTLETGVFFASVATGMSPERQGYEERLCSF